MYRAGQTRPKKSRRILRWGFFSLFLLAAVGAAALSLRGAMKPQVKISQSQATVTHVTYKTTTKTYTEPDFTILLPSSWHPVSRPAGPYNSYTWQSSDVGSDGQVIVIYEDTIPANFAVNRVLIVQNEQDHISLSGTASDNCATFTGAAHNAGQAGAPAKWQGVSFLCDQLNQERDVIGTSSSDGVNTVILKSQSTGHSHRFFFTYTDYAINPDYTVFYNALNTFQLN